MNKKQTLMSLALVSSFVMTSCTKVDDYMLGKDNSPKPTPLKQVKSDTTMKVVWTKAVGSKGGSRDALKLSPVIAGVNIYTADYNGVVTATNRSNAELKWQNQTNQKIVSGPVVGSNAVAITTADAKLIVLDKQTGKVKWTQALSNEALSPPVISNDKIVVKSIDGKLFAFNLTTSKRLWLYDHGSPNLILRTGSAPVVKGKLVMVGFADGKLDGINIDSGQLLWQRSLSYSRGSSDVERLVDIDAKPLIRNNTAFTANYQGFVTALSLTSGQFLWRHPLSTYKNLSLSPRHLYATDSNDVVWALDSGSGKTLWHQDGLKARKVSAPSTYDNNLLVGDEFGFLHLLASNDGHVKSRLQLPYGAIGSAPLVAGKDIFVLTENGILVKLAIG